MSKHRYEHTATTWVISLLSRLIMALASIQAVLIRRAGKK